MAELTAEYDAITDAYNLQAKKFSETGEDSFLAGQRIFPVGGGIYQEYSVASLNMKNLGL